MSDLSDEKFQGPSLLLRLWRKVRPIRQVSQPLHECYCGWAEYQQRTWVAGPKIQDDWCKCLVCGGEVTIVRLISEQE